MQVKRLIIILLICTRATLAFGQWTGIKPILGRQVDWSHPLSEGLKLCLLANEGAGISIKDLSGNGYHTTGILGTAPTWVGGVHGVTPYLNSLGGYNLPVMSSILSANPRTISVWFSADAFGGLTEPIYVQSITGFGGANGSLFNLFAEDNGVSIAYAGHRQLFGSGELSVDTWYNFTGVVPDGAVNTGDVIGYINGVLKTPSDKAGSSQTLDTLSGIGRIGINEINTNYFDGKISSLMIWERALSANEIAQLVREPFGFMQGDIPVSQMYSYAAAETGQFIFISAIPVWLFAGCLLYLNRKKAA